MLRTKEPLPFCATLVRGVELSASKRFPYVLWGVVLTACVVL